MARPRPSIPGPLTITRALREYLATEVAGGVVLLVATAAALIWANSPWDGAYQRLWETDLAIRLGTWSISLDLRHWVNEGLMAVFFVVVGLEVKRELFEGELRDPRRAALPVVAAFGGMVVPALLFLALNAGGEGHAGWGIPMATDIAFALGVAAIVARRLPSSLRLFLLTLAIVDDVGAILVIALVYSSDISWQWLAIAGGLLVGAYVIREAGVVYTPVFVTCGAGLWLALHEAGVHATLAGVAMGMLAPTRPSKLARNAVSQVERLEHALHPWSSLVIVPLFALANAGVSLSADGIGDAFGSPVTWGVVIGLVVGKTIGISGFAWLACRVRIASLPPGAGWGQLVGMAALGGIGFTVSLFIAGLAFTDAELVDEAKIGILASSVLATLAGSLILLAAGRGADDS